MTESLQELGARLRKAWYAWRYVPGPDTTALSVAIGSLLSRLDAQPEVGDGSRWISVEDQLPKGGQLCLLVCNKTVGFGYKRSGDFTGSKAAPWIMNGHSQKSITHWAALPAPPSA